MNMLAQFSQNQKTMSSREIAELCKARHNDVITTIERLFEKGLLRESRKTLREYISPNGGRPTMVYDLTKNDTLKVVSGYSDEVRSIIIDRWDELERQIAQSQITLPNFADPAEAAIAWANEYKAKQLAIQERDHAIATKAEIGSRREATALGRLSAKVKEVEKLKTKLDSSMGFATIKKVQSLTGGTYDTYELRRYSKANHLEIQKAEDANYGSVNSYHKDAWLAVYNINLSNLNGVA